MTTLSPLEIQKLEIMVTELHAGVTPYSDEIDRILSDAAPALIAMAKHAQTMDEAYQRALLYHQDRAEKAEAESARYREMAIRLEKALDGICKERLGTTFDRLFAHETVTSADIADLLKDNAEFLVSLLNAAPALIAMAKPEMWCLSCGTLSRDGTCDCTAFPDHADKRRAVPYTDEMQKIARESMARAEKAEVEAARYRNMAVRLAKKDQRRLPITLYAQAEEDIADLLKEEVANGQEK